MGISKAQRASRKKRAWKGKMKNPLAPTSLELDPKKASLRHTRGILARMRVDVLAYKIDDVKLKTDAYTLRTVEKQKRSARTAKMHAWCKQKRRLTAIGYVHVPSHVYKPLPLDCMFLVMQYLPSLRSIMSYVSAVPGASKVFVRYHRQIIVAVLKRTMPLELQKLISAVINVRICRPRCPGELENLYSQIDNLEDPQLLEFPDPISKFLEIATVEADLEALFQSFVELRIEKPSSIYAARRPASATEQHRVRRGFWRFQLFCDLLHHGYINDFKRSWSFPCCKVAENFVGRLAHWEGDELRAIHTHLISEVNILLSRRDSDTSKSDEKPLYLQRLFKQLDFEEGVSVDDGRGHFLMRRYCFFRPRYAVREWPDSAEASNPTTTLRQIFEIAQKQNSISTSPKISMLNTTWAHMCTTKCCRPDRIMYWGDWGWNTWDLERLQSSGFLEFEHPEPDARGAARAAEKHAKITECQGVEQMYDTFQELYAKQTSRRATLKRAELKDRRLQIQEERRQQARLRRAEGYPATRSRAQQSKPARQVRRSERIS